MIKTAKGAHCALPGKYKPTYTVGIGRALICGFAMLLIQQTAFATPPISLHSFRPQHKELQWLKRFLTLRGYQLTQQKPLGVVSLRVKSRTIVVFTRGNTTQSYQLPSHIHSARVRARMMVTYLSLFVDNLPKQKTSPTLQQPPARRVQARPPASRQRPVTRRKRLIRRRLRPVQRRLRPVRKLVRLIPLKRRFRRRQISAVTAKKPLTRPPRTRAQSRPTMGKPRIIALHLLPKTTTKRKKRVAPAIKRPRQPAKQTPRTTPKNVSTAPRGIVARPRPPRSQLWGEVLGIALGLGGGLRLSRADRILGGGGLLMGFDAWRWTFRVDLSLHSFYLMQQQRIILLLRPAFWVGWNIPLQRMEQWLQLRILGGLSSEWFVKEANDAYTTELQWGVMVGLQLHIRLYRTSRQDWSLFARPMLFLYPGGTTTPARDTASPLLQFGALAGIQVRL